MDHKAIETIGTWTVRVLLVLGAIGLSCLGKYEAAGTCGIICVISFFLL